MKKGLFLRSGLFLVSPSSGKELNSKNTQMPRPKHKRGADAQGPFAVNLLKLSKKELSKALASLLENLKPVCSDEASRSYRVGWMGWMCPGTLTCKKLSGVQIAAAYQASKLVFCCSMRRAQAFLSTLLVYVLGCKIIAGQQKSFCHLFEIAPRNNISTPNKRHHHARNDANI